MDTRGMLVSKEVGGYKINAVRLVDTDDMENDRWLECRKHGPDGKIPFTVGGSDVATVFGISPWNTPLELWRTKAGTFTPPPKDNASQLAMGHYMEDMSAALFEERMNNASLGEDQHVYRLPCKGKGKYKVYKDTWMYQHRDCPWALADFDRIYTRPDGSTGILELKTTNFRYAEKWADGAFPAYYETQLRFYMWLADVQYGAFCCLSGFNPDNECYIVEIERDLEYEEEMVEKLASFIESLEIGIEPTMEEVDPKQALEGLARLYPVAKAMSAEMELSASAYGQHLKVYTDCDAGIKELKAQIKTLEERRDAASVKIKEAVGDNPSAFCEMGDTVYSVGWKNRKSKSVDYAAMKKEAPDVYDRYVSENTSRTFSVKKYTKDTKK